MSTQAKTAPTSKTAKRNRVILEHLPLVKAIAVRVRDGLPVHVDLDDLIHAGVLGLIDAATKYDSNKGVSFSSYSKYRIRGAMLDSLRELDWASRDIRKRFKQVDAAVSELSSELHRKPTEPELADKLGVDLTRLRQFTLSFRNLGLVSGSTRPSATEDLPAPDFADNPAAQPESICSHLEMRTALNSAMGALPERYRKVVFLYYSDEKTMREIGGILGINESRVSQIHKSALQKMATVLASTGIHSSQAF